MKRKTLEEILEEIAKSGDMSFTCPNCGDIMDLETPECGCGFINPVMNGNVSLRDINKHAWMK